MRYSTLFLAFNLLKYYPEVHICNLRTETAGHGMSAYSFFYFHTCISIGNCRRFKKDFNWVTASYNSSSPHCSLLLICQFIYQNYISTFQAKFSGSVPNWFARISCLIFCNLQAVGAQFQHLWGVFGAQLELSSALSCSFFLRPNWQSIKWVSWALFAARADAFRFDLATTRCGAQSLVFNSSTTQ